MEHSIFADFFFVNAARIQNVIYTLEGDFYVARQRPSYFVVLSVFQQFILRSTSNHIFSLFIQQIGYHFSFHRSMMKEFTIISTPDLRCISFYSPMYGERYMTSSSRLFTFEDISQIFPDTGFTILLLLRTISRTISFFLFHFQQGYNKTQSKEFKCWMYSRPHAKPTANNNLSVLFFSILQDDAKHHGSSLNLSLVPSRHLI